MDFNGRHAKDEAMSSEPPAPARPRKRNGWLPILIFGVGFALFVTFLIGQQASPLSVATRLEAEPALGATVTAFRDAYPGDYQRFVAALAAIENRDGQEAADREALPRLRTFIAGKAEAIASAPVAELDALADANLATLLRLRQAGVPLCAAFMANGAQGERLPAAALATVSQANALQFRAARAGESRRRVQRGALSEADGAQWFLRIRAISPPLARAINDGSIDRGTPEQRCAAGIALYRAAAELPPEQAANVTAHLVRESFRANRR